MMTPPVTPVTFIRGAPIDVPHFGPIGVRIVSGQKAQLATGGEDGSELLSEKDWWKWWKKGFFPGKIYKNPWPCQHSERGSLLSSAISQLQLW